MPQARRVHEHGIETVDERRGRGDVSAGGEDIEDRRSAVDRADGVDHIEPRHRGVPPPHRIEEESIQRGLKERRVARRHEHPIAEGRLESASEAFDRPLPRATIDQEGGLGHHGPQGGFHIGVCDGDEKLLRETHHDVGHTPHHRHAADLE